MSELREQPTPLTEAMCQHLRSDQKVLARHWWPCSNAVWEAHVDHIWDSKQRHACLLCTLLVLREGGHE